MKVDTLRHLEARIEDMLSQHAAVCAERDRLQDQLGVAQGRIESLMAELRQHQAERAEVKAHVERIMGRLDGLDLG
jgi:chromosome segregation ATPase